jgi:hypothetical protein
MVSCRAVDEPACAGRFQTGGGTQRKDIGTDFPFRQREPVCEPRFQTLDKDRLTACLQIRRMPKIWHLILRNY